MDSRWMVTPFFLDEHEPTLADAVPGGVPFRLNDQGGAADRSAESLFRTHEPIASFVGDCVSDKVLPVSVAGDCVASLPVIAGLQHAGLDPVVVWLDAHGDFNTGETSPSGFLGGMPLAMMVGRGDLSMPERLGQVPVREDVVWLVGARDLDPLEREALEASQVHRMDLEELKALEFDGPVYLHIDNDIIDASEAPANNYPVSGGPGLRDVIEACVAFASRNRLCAISLSGWNGKLDTDGRTGRACAELVAAVVAAPA